MATEPDPKPDPEQPKSGDPYLAEVLAERIAEERRQHGWTQADLAKRMAGLGHEWNQFAVSRVETGVRGVSIEEWIDLAMILQVPGLSLFHDRQGRDVLLTDVSAMGYEDFEHVIGLPIRGETTARWLELMNLSERLKVSIEEARSQADTATLLVAVKHKELSTVEQEIKKLQSTMRHPSYELDEKDEGKLQ